jgi:hypothetical protein
MIKPSKKILRLVQVLVGSMDTLTGLLLIFLPAATLKLMGIPALEGGVTMLSWVGVFVFGVGVSYFLVCVGEEGEGAWGAWRMQWKMTALVRIAVGSFVLWKIGMGALDAAWWTVAGTDFLVAGGQLWGLWQGWLGGRETR